MARITLEEIRRRKLAQWLVAYLAAAWLVLQIAGTLSDTYGWPPLVTRALPVLLGIGVLAAAVLGWYHGEKGAQRVNGIELVMLAGILVIAAVGVSWAREDPVAAAVASVPDTTPQPGSIAVLPFVNMSSDPEQEYFSDGLTEELLNVLAQIPELRVAARTSAFAFKDAHVPIDSIGRALGVAHVLEGSVRRSGERVRITAQLVRTDNGFHVWSDTYDREIRDVFAVQDEISRAIVDALRVELGAVVGVAPVVRATSDPEAHTRVLRAIALLRQRGPAELAEAEALLREAIELDPGYAAAHAHLAQVFHQQGYSRHRPAAEGYRLARESAARAIELDPGQPDAHAVLGRLADTVDWDFRGAAEHFRRALERNPSHETALIMSAWLQMRLDDAEGSIATARRAVEVSPISMSAYNTLAAMYAYAGQSVRAIELYEAALALDSTAAVIHANLALSLAQVNRHAEAGRHVDIAAAADPRNPFYTFVDGYVAARAGDRATALERIRDLEADESASPYDIAALYAALGKHDRAFALLDGAVDRHDDIVADLGVDPVFDAMRGDPRMTSLLERIGLPTS